MYMYIMVAHNFQPLTLAKWKLTVTPFLFITCIGGRVPTCTCIKL